MRRILLILVLLLSSISFNIYSKEEDDDDPRVFFPQRPEYVKLHKITGILEDYGVGNRGGGLSIILPNGKSVEFAVGGAFALGGVTILPCRVPNYIRSDGTIEVNCPEWSKEFILNKTHVIVTYWYQKHYYSNTDIDGTVSRDYHHYIIEKVTDQVDLVK